MSLEDRVLREMHGLALDAGRPSVSVPSSDLDSLSGVADGKWSAQSAIQRLVRSGRVTRVRRDLLVLPDSTGRLKLDLPDLIDVVAPQPYLITAGRALEHHDLIDQHFFGVTVLTPKELEPLSFRGQSAKFVKTDVENIWDWVETPRPRYALPERAIVDALNHPRYGVSLSLAVDALLAAERRDPNFTDRLLDTVRRFESPAIARRVGYVVHRFVGPDAAMPFRKLIGQNRSPVMLRPTGRRTGDVDSAWRVLVNAGVQPEKVDA
jgi:predicted transcriptional regulator of viral defense system